PLPPEAQALGDLEAMASRPEAALSVARALFAITSVRPELSQLKPPQAEADAMVQSVDRALVSILARCVDPDHRLSGGAPAEAPAAGSLEPGAFFYQLATVLPDLHKTQESTQLLAKFLVSTRDSGRGGEGPQRRLHGSSALHWLHSLLALGAPGSPEVQ